MSSIAGFSSKLPRLLVVGGYGCVYHNFVQKALNKNYGVTALLQNPTLLGHIKTPAPVMQARPIPTLKVEYPESYSCELLDKKAAVMFINFMEEVIVPNDYFDLVEQLIPAMMTREVKKLVIVASDGEFVDETLNNIRNYVNPIKQIDETIIKYRRNPQLADKYVKDSGEYSGHLSVSNDLNYLIDQKDQGFMIPSHVTRYIFEAIEDPKKSKNCMAICRPARFT